MKTFKDSLRDELHKQKITYFIKSISYTSLSLNEILIISNVLGKNIYDMCDVKGIKNINQI